MYTLTIQAETADELRAKIKELVGSQPGYDQPAVDEVTTKLEGTVKAKKEAAEITEADPGNTPTMEDVKALIVKHIEQGKRDEVLGVLKKYGAKKMQDVSEADWESFTDEVKSL